MSANRDKNQKFTFMYENLYRIYRDTKPSNTPVEQVIEGPKAPIRRGPPKTSGIVLKAENLKSEEVEVRPYTPAELRAPDAMALAPNAAIDSLKKNLNQLNELHQRLRFMLSELEELAKE